MRIIRPPWINHGNKDRREKGLEVQIYAIDIHPDGTKVATAGEGDLGGRICIWNVKPILSEDVEHKENVPKLLSRLDSHQQCVNTLRWSNSGEYFASGGGDKLIMIWSSNGDNKYKSIATLRTHTLDVNDLAWSPNDEFLASCSIDNLIIIWNAQQWPEIVKVIRKHENYVKGVSWDPIGKYLASQSDDKTLRVWRVSDWSEEASVSEPFENCNSSSTVTRIAWSPDGQYLVSAQAINNEGFVSKIIERKDWSYGKDFVGHRKNITCVAFSPHIFKKSVSSKKKEFNDQTKFKPLCVLAIGSRDRSISIWETSKIRPIVVVNDLFENSVMDLSWSPCGYRLMACSLDGTVVLLQFNATELGEPYSSEEKTQYLQSFYGKSYGTRKIRDTLIEDVNVFLAQKDLNGVQANGTLSIKNEKKEDKPVLVNGNKNHLEKKENGTSEAKTQPEVEEENKDKSPSIANNSKQIEFRQADGKKRIMTLLKPKNQSVSVGEISSSSSESKTKFIIETYDESNLPTEVKEKFLASKSANKDDKDASFESKDDDDEDVKRSRADEAEESSEDEQIIVRRKPKKKDLSDDDEDEEEVGGKKRKSIRPPSNRKEHKSEQEIIVLNEDSQSLLRQPAPKVKRRPIVATQAPQRIQVFSSQKLPRQNQQNLKLFGEIEKFIYAGIEYPSASSSLVKLIITEEQNFLWCSILSSPITFLCGNSELIVAVCEDLTLNTFNANTGARINVAFVIESNIAKIMFGENKSHVCVLTCEGKLWIWDVVKPVLILKGISVIPILIDPKTNDKMSIVKLNIEKNSKVVISVSNGKTFQFEKSIEAWCLVKHHNDPLAVSANFKGSKVNAFKVESLKTPSQNLLTLFSANTSFAQLSLISFVEQQISTAKLVHKRSDYDFWIKILIQNLVQMHSSGFNMDNIESRIRDHCTSLLGSKFPKISDFKEQTGEDSPSLFKDDADKKTLLGELLKIIASQTSLQRLYLEFKEQLDLFDEPMQTS